MLQMWCLRHFSSHSALPSITSLNSTIREMLQKHEHANTLLLYKHELHPQKLHANPYLLPSILKASSHSPHFTPQLHSIALKSASLADPVVANSLLSAYDKLSETNSAYKVFDDMPHRDSVSWNAMANCFLSEEGKGCIERAVEVVKDMLRNGVAVKAEVLAGVVSRGGVGFGKAVHGWVLVLGNGSGFGGNVVLGSALVGCYMRGGEVGLAVRVFEGMEVRNVVAWTVLISGCVANGEFGLAVEFFCGMLRDRVGANRVSLLMVLPAFAEMSGGDGCVREIHGFAVRRGFDRERRFRTSLVHAYCKCGGSVGMGKVVFEEMELEGKDVVMWSSIVAGYCGVGDGSEGVKMFGRMREEGVQPNDVTVLSVVSCCAANCLLELGCGVHGYALKSGVMFYVSIGNSLMNMYSKCGCLPASCQIFKEMSLKDSISWSALISCYGIHGRGYEALEVFREMQKEGMQLDSITYLALLSACNHAGLIEEGQKIFGEAVKDKKLEVSVEHYSCYIDLLGRSGKIEEACETVRTMPMKPSAKIWSSLVSACKDQKRFDVAKILAPCLIKSEPRNASNYTLLSMIYAESGNWFDVKEVRRFMGAHKMGKCHGFSRI